jgi:hypothetical protein
MKKRILGVVAMLTVVLAVSAFGYTHITGVVKADIPFDFMVSGKTLQAGTYNVQRGSTGVTVLIRKVNGNDAATSIVMNGETTKADGKARLVFNRYGNEYFLTEIWDGSSSTTTQLPKSKAERAAQKRNSDRIANGSAQPEKVIVYAD